MKTIKTEIEWYDAKEVTPAKSGMVYVIHNTDIDGNAHIQDVYYNRNNGHFNDTVPMDDIKYWAYPIKMQEEDDF